MYFQIRVYCIVVHRVTSHSRAGTFGAVMEYGAEKKVSQHSWLAASVAVGVPSGVTLKIK
jgi:DnaJ family protein C protein 11